MTGRLLLIVVASFSFTSAYAQQVLERTWRLVSAKRTNTTTRTTVDTYGPTPKGYIIYGRDGHMMVINMTGNRPRPASMESITDDERKALFSSMLAYAGTYEFDGQTIRHHIDISWNELLSGTTQVRYVKKDGNRLIYTTRPGASPRDGSMGFTTLVWEKVD